MEYPPPENFLQKIKKIFIKAFFPELEWSIFQFASEINQFYWHVLFIYLFYFDTIFTLNEKILKNVSKILFL